MSSAEGRPPLSYRHRIVAVSIFLSFDGDRPNLPIVRIVVILEAVSLIPFGVRVRGIGPLSVNSSPILHVPIF